MVVTKTGKDWPVQVRKCGEIGTSSGLNKG